MKTERLRKNLAAIVLAGAMSLAGCKKEGEETRPERQYSNEVIHLYTARQVRIEPHYGQDSILMDGIVLTKFVHEGFEVSNLYLKNSPEYESLRPLLTVEQIRDGFGDRSNLISTK